MTPLFSATAPWASRVLLIAGLICLPIAGLLLHEILSQQQIEQQIHRVSHQLDLRKAALLRLSEAQQQRREQADKRVSVPPAIAFLDRIAAVTQPDVILQSIDIVTVQREARLKVNPASLNALLAFSERLEKLNTRVVLESHRTSTDSAAARSLSATLTVQFPQEPADVQTH